MEADKRLLLVVGVALGLALTVFRYKDAFSFRGLGADECVIMQTVDPGLGRGDPQLRATMLSSRFYLLGTRALGYLLARAHVGKALLPTLNLLQLALWAIQLYFFFLLTKNLSQDTWTAVLATILFGWGVSLFRIADSTTMTVITMRRSLGLTLVLPSLLLYFSGRKTPAWLLITLAIYAHINPGMFVLILFGLEDGLLVLNRAEPLGTYILRLLCAGLLLAPPILLSEASMKTIPPHYMSFGYAILGDFADLVDIGWTDWLLYFEGVALIALAWPAFKPIAGSERVLRMFFWSICLTILAGATRAFIYPMGLPLGSFFLKLTGGFAYLCPASILGLIVICRWIARSWEKEEKRWATLCVLFALMSSALLDYALRLPALAVMLCFIAAGPWLALAEVLPWAWLAGSAFAAWQIPRLTLLWSRTLHLSGGIFLLPAFHWITPGAILLALAAASIARRMNPKHSMFAVVAFCLASASVLHPAKPLAEEVSWRQTMAWVKTHTPPESFFLLQAPGVYDFLANAQRAPFSTNEDYAKMLYEFGPPALPLVKRLEDVGYNFTCCSSMRQVDAEIVRVNQALDLPKIRQLARKYGLTHLLVSEPLNPARSLAAAYQNGPFKVYELAAQGPSPYPQKSGD